MKISKIEKLILLNNPLYLFPDINHSMFKKIYYVSCNYYLLLSTIIITTIIYLLSTNILPIYSLNVN